LHENQLLFDILAFTMPYISDCKQVLHEIELAVLIANDNDDDKAAEEILELYAVTSSSCFIQDHIRQH
jgi:hypothetical protein